MTWLDLDGACLRRDAIGIYETINRSDVTLVDVSSDPIQRMVPTELCTKSCEYELDMVIFPMGFEAGTRSFIALEVRAKGTYRSRTSGPMGLGRTWALPSIGSRTCS